MFKINSIYINPLRTYSSVKGTGNIYRVYKNPNAENLFIKAQNAKTFAEREKLFKEMGEYEIVTEPEKHTQKNRFMQFLRGLFNAY